MTARAGIVHTRIKRVDTITALLAPASGAVWAVSNGFNVYMDAINKITAWSAPIREGYSQWRWIVHYQFNNSGTSLRHYTQSTVCGAVASYNIHNAFDIMYGSQNVLNCKYHDWNALDGSRYTVGGYIKMNNSGVQVRIYSIEVQAK